jgi:hypothetical protein
MITTVLALIEPAGISHGLFRTLPKYPTVERDLGRLKDVLAVLAGPADICSLPGWKRGFFAV